MKNIRKTLKKWKDRLAISGLSLLVLGCPTLENPQEMALRSFAKADSEYGEYSNTLYLMANGNDVYRGQTPELAVQTLPRVHALAHEVDSAEINIGEGEFREEDRLNFHIPIDIKGQGKDKTKLVAQLGFFEDSTIIGVNFDGSEIVSGMVSAGGGEVYNSRFNGRTSLRVDTAYDTSIEGNEFVDCSVAPLRLVDSGTKSTEPRPTLTMRRNLFENMDLAIACNMRTDAGTSDDIGENVFRDVNTVFYNYFDTTQQLTGNYVADTISTKNDSVEELVYISPEDFIRDKTLCDAGELRVDFMLDYNPLEQEPYTPPKPFRRCGTGTESSLALLLPAYALSKRKGKK